jgi:hypothetical protein
MAIAALCRRVQACLIRSVSKAGKTYEQLENNLFYGLLAITFISLIGLIMLSFVEEAIGGSPLNSNREMDNPIREAIKRDRNLLFLMDVIFVISE